jgi:cystathionine gamma-synthase
MSRRFSTILAQAGVDDDAAFGSVMPPLYLSSNYSFEGLGKRRTYDYSRAANPTRDVLGAALAALEGGAGGVITASGMAAIDVVLGQQAVGDLILAPHDCYGGTHRLLTERARRGSFRLAFVDQGDPEALAAALAQRPALVLVETPSNPLMRVVDIAAIANAAHEVGAKVAVDNTFLSPALQNPIALGADYVIHSTTKYINGHSDVIGGAVVAASAADAEAITFWANCTGATGSPFDAYLTLRGLRTLVVRIKQQEATAQRIAELLDQHPTVTSINYPGLPSHPQHQLAKVQQKGFGAMLSFSIATDEPGLSRFLGALKIFTLAESLGGVESLVAHPASMTHASMDPKARLDAGITDGLLRLSIGLEDADDLLADLQQALAKLG